MGFFGHWTSSAMQPVKQTDEFDNSFWFLAILGQILRFCNFRAVTAFGFGRKISTSSLMHLIAAWQTISEGELRASTQGIRNYHLGSQVGAFPNFCEKDRFSFINNSGLSLDWSFNRDKLKNLYIPPATSIHKQRFCNSRRLSINQFVRRMEFSLLLQPSDVVWRQLDPRFQSIHRESHN